MKVKYLGRLKICNQNFGGQRYSWNKENDYMIDIPEDFFKYLLEDFPTQYQIVSTDLSEVTIKAYFCPKCKKSFPTLRGLGGHERRVHFIKPKKVIKKEAEEVIGDNTDEPGEYDVSTL
jgi:hypothetical protein